MKFPIVFAIILSIACAVSAGKKNGSPTVSNSHPGSHSGSSTSSSQPSTTVTINGQQMVYPALDQIPDIKDSYVQEILKALDLSQVPNLPRSNGGVINRDQPTCNETYGPDQGSWTCQKYTAPDDIRECPKTNNWGVTYDDGPSASTPLLLDALDKYNLKATLFVIGSRVASNPNILKDAYTRGHHIACHTWSHPALTSLSNEQIVAELAWTIKIIKDITGVTPVYYRPPYGDTDNRVRYITKAMGLITVLWVPEFDSNDWIIVGPPPKPISVVTDTFQKWMKVCPTMSTGFIVLEHDLYPETVQAAIAILELAVKVPNLNMTTVPQCVGDSKLYVEQGGSYNNFQSLSLGTNTATSNSTTVSPSASTSSSSSSSSASSAPSGKSSKASDSTSTNAPKSSGNTLVITILPITFSMLALLFTLK